MKVVLWSVAFFISALFLFGSPVHAQSLLAPVPEEITTKPKLVVLAPDKDSVVPSKFTLEMNVANFELTAKPVDSPQAGVIAIYVDGKFFTNTASTSAQLTIPRAGTHHVEVELTHVDRSSLVPRITDSLFVHVQKKSPYLEVAGLRADAMVYSSTPTFPIIYQQASFEEKSGYYQVFVDGAVDGNSKDAEDPSLYTIHNDLPEGKHSLRIALYTENDRPFVPTVEYQVPFTYSQNRPVIEDVSFSKEVIPNTPVPFVVNLTGFVPGKDGYIDVLAEGIHYYIDKEKSQLPRLSAGNQKVTITLLDINGFPLNPTVTSEKIIPVSAGQEKQPLPGLIPAGIFTTAEDGEQPRWGFLILGAIEALAIVVFGVLLLRHEQRHK